MTVVLLVRHGVTDMTGKRLYGRSAGVHLSQRGREQAQHLAARLERVPLRAVYASPLERCVETAEAIASPRGMEVERVDGLLEIDYGRWTGRPLAAVARTKLWRRVHGGNPSGIRFPEGETLVDAQLRGVAALERIAQRHPRGVVVAVTHGDLAALALAHFAGLHIDLFQRLEIAPGSVSVVAFGDGVPRIRRVNDTGTLDDLVPPRGARRVRD